MVVRLLSLFFFLFFVFVAGVFFNCLRSMLSVGFSIRLKVPLFCAGVNASPHHHPVEGN